VRVDRRVDACRRVALHQHPSRQDRGPLALLMRERPRSYSRFWAALLKSFWSANEQSPEGGQVFVTIGRVVEITPTYVVLEALRGQSPRTSAGNKFLLGMAHVVAMNVISHDMT
jgi:hypothetical protein